MELLIFAFILFMLIGTSFIIYQAKWESFFQSLRKLAPQLSEAWEEAKQEVLQEEQANSGKKQEEKPPFYLRAALPLFHILLFPIFIALFTIWDWSPFAQKNPLVLFLFVFAVLTSLVFYVLQKDSKSFCIKFWLCLFISLVAEFSLAFECTLLLNGYFFRSVSKMKHLGSTFFILFLFIETYLQTQRNWLSWRIPTKINHEDLA